MGVIKVYSRRSFFWIIFFMALLCGLMDGALYIALDFISGSLFDLSASPDAPLDFIQKTNDMVDMVNQYYIPASACVFLMTALLMWLSLRACVKGVVKKYGAEVPKQTAAAPKLPEIDKKAKERSEKRLFLHLFSVLQREGRLMDFFAEDLEEYEDEDIGAAVRSIHENCKKTMEKYFKAEPVLAEEEEEEITVEPGFDPNTIKLTGNVAGEPPFKGVVRHRGWKSQKIELPELSGDRDPGIIAPAEVEIL